MKNICWYFDLPKIKLLLKRGFKLNDKNGGSSVLQMCLEGTGILVFRCDSARATKAWEAAVELAEMGARWVPDPRDMFLVRCGLRHTDIEKWVEVAAVLLKTGAADHATLGKLFGSPWMRAHLRYCRGEEAMAAILGAKWWQPKRGRRER